MHLRNLRLTDFKNYTSLDLELSPGINLFAGPNGAGKTNLLDAIYLLCLTKSAFQSVDIQVIAHEKQEAIVRGEIMLDDKRFMIGCAIAEGKRKVLMLNRKAYGKVSDHIGKFPLVLIAPNDQELILEGSELRRKFFDNILCQMDQDYLYTLLQYQKVLQHRNSLLKLFGEKGLTDPDQLEPWDLKILSLGKKLYESRHLVLEKFLPPFSTLYAELSNSKEQVEVVYQSDWLQPDHPDRFRQALSKDLILKRTTKGAHRDDYEFLINGYPAKKYGSQGQQKSFLIALKLAQFEVLKQETGKTPILLLDDIFDKLDDERIACLVQMAGGGRFGQVFITDARPERSLQLLENMSLPKAFFSVDQGRVEAIAS